MAKNDFLHKNTAGEKPAASHIYII